MRGGAGFGALLAAFLLASALCYAPERAREPGDLLPVETLCAVRRGGTVTVTGEGVSGSGESWEAALDDLRASAPGAVFLETVEKIAVAESAADCLPAVRREPDLRPAVRLFLLRGEAGPELPAFLLAQTGGAGLKTQAPPPEILEENGRYRLAAGD